MNRLQIFPTQKGKANHVQNKSPTKSVELQLKEEHAVIRMGYEFLDEKRILLAAEMLRYLNKFESLKKAHGQAMDDARATLHDAVARHGFDALQVYPLAPLEPSTPKITSRLFLGIALLEADLNPEPTAPEYRAVEPSAEVEATTEAFRHLVSLAAKLASVSGNLNRLSVEFRRTEQRARALENVLIPEIKDDLKRIGDQLEMIEQEEIMRVRLAGQMSDAK